ncbi:Uncharacterized protein LW93_4979 [Fusarium fujikuroi]|nr:Uncharacterized protein LW93_4979 [Fusarium fujikuroi]
MADESESPEPALLRLDDLRNIEIGDAVYPKPPAEFHTMTLTITREQALARVGELVRQVQNAEFDQEPLKPQMELSMDFHIFSELIQKFEGVLTEDMYETSWEYQLPGERIEMLDSDVAAPSMEALADILNQLPKKGRRKHLRVRGIEAFNDLKNILHYQQGVCDDYYKLIQNRCPNTSAISHEALEQLKGSLVNAVRDEFESKKSAPQDIVDDFKTIYAQYRRDGLVVPRELHNVAAYSLSRDQHKEVLAARGDQEMADG